MIALFYVMRLINGDTTYDRVPRIIQDDVDRVLTERGHERLIGSDSE